MYGEGEGNPRVRHWIQYVKFYPEWSGHVFPVVPAYFASPTAGAQSARPGTRARDVRTPSHRRPRGTRPGLRTRSLWPTSAACNSSSSSSDRRQRKRPVQPPAHQPPPTGPSSARSFCGSRSLTVSGAHGKRAITRTGRVWEKKISAPTTTAADDATRLNGQGKRHYTRPAFQRNFPIIIVVVVLNAAYTPRRTLRSKWTIFRNRKANTANTSVFVLFSTNQVRCSNTGIFSFASPPPHYSNH